jgi:hypothetical protein
MEEFVHIACGAAFLCIMAWLKPPTWIPTGAQHSSNKKVMEPDILLPTPLTEALVNPFL